MSNNNQQQTSTSTSTTTTATTKQRPLRFAVKKLIRNRTGDRKWDVVALYNDTNNFLGPADNFESMEAAQKYIQSYKNRMNNRPMGKFSRGKSSISLKVFEVGDEDDSNY